MAFTNLEFTKDWTEDNPADSKYFKTHESNETQVRADWQLLFNEIKSWCNNLIGDNGLKDAANIGMGQASAHFTSTDVKGALEELYQLVIEVEQGAVPNHSITNAKLVDEDDINPATQLPYGAPVGTKNIQDSAVTTAKINDGAISSAKLASASVVEGKIAASAVTSGKIADGAVTKDKIGTYQVTHNRLTTTAGVEGAAVWNDNIKDECINPVEKLSDTVPVPTNKGGTGLVVDNLAGIRNALGLGNTLLSLPIANGGTGATTATGARENLSIDTATLGAQIEHKVSSATILATDWDSNTKEAIIDVTGVTVNNDCLPMPKTNSWAAYRNYGVRADDTYSVAGKIKFKCDVIPTDKFSKSTNNTALTITLDENTFKTKCGGVSITKVFTYTTEWDAVLSEWGLAVTGTPASGNTITVVFDAAANIQLNVLIFDYNPVG